MFWGKGRYDPEIISPFIIYCLLKVVEHTNKMNLSLCSILKSKNPFSVFV